MGGVSKADERAELGPYWRGQCEPPLGIAPDDQGNAPPVGRFSGEASCRGENLSGDPCSQDMCEGKRE